MRSAAFLIPVLALMSAACESQPFTAPSNTVVATPGEAAARPGSSSTFSATIHHHAVLTDEGAAVAANLACPSGYSVREAFVMLSQDGGRVAGQGGFAGVVCDGTSRAYVASLRPVEGAFRRGSANASGYMLVCDAADADCRSLNFSRRVVLRSRSR
jgi:hypothetical protein